MADLVYDTVAKGQLTSTSRYDGVETYTHQINSYDDGYRPTSATDTIPGFGAAGGTLSYATTATFRVNGVPDTQVLRPS